MTAGRMLFGIGSRPLPSLVSTIAPSGSRTTIRTGGNIYSQGLVKLDDNGQSLLHFYTEATTEHASDSAAYMRASSNGGATWGSPTTLFSGTTGRHGQVEGAFRTSTGRILVSLDDQSNSNPFDVICKVIYSDDSGATWSSPYTVPNSFSGDCVGGPFLELPNGDVVMAGYGEQSGVVGGNTFARLYRSTNGGATFPTEVTIASSASRTYQEPRLCWVGGKLVAFMRSDTNVHTWRVESSDYGATWGAAADVVAISGPPDPLAFTPDRVLLIGRNNNTVWRGRYATSADGGVTWTSPTELDTGETRELDGTAIVETTPGHYLTIYALANSGSSSTVYSRAWVAS